MEPGMSAVKIPASEKPPKSAAHGPRTGLRNLAQV
jgi:DNA-binding NarL/FixJ family response regulator